MKIQNITIEEFVLLKWIFRNNLTNEIIDKIVRINGSMITVSNDDEDYIKEKIIMPIDSDGFLDDEYHTRIWVIGEPEPLDLCYDMAKIINERMGS